MAASIAEIVAYRSPVEHWHVALRDHQGRASAIPGRFDSAEGAFVARAAAQQNANALGLKRAYCVVSCTGTHTL